jgi:UDP-galactopyranose mutase
MKIKTDFLIVGAGFYGSVLAERISSILNKKVIIIDKRNHIGGNCFSEIDKTTKIEYHKYGTHIFHTSSEIVWKYISNFFSLNSYRHQVLSKYKNKIYQLPINLETINSFFGKNFTPLQAENFLKKKTDKYKNNEYSNFEEKAFSQIGTELYNAFIKGYTKKQWGKDPKKLPSIIFNRLPLRFNYKEDYFLNCKYQGIPASGYTDIFKKLLSGKNIEFVKKKKFNLLKNEYDIKYLTIYTGPLDELFNYKLGKLEWRSLRFEKEILNIDDYQGTSVINFPEIKYPYTRIHEPKHLHPEREYSKNKTLTIKEFPVINHDEPYYPINTNFNRLIHRKYKQLAREIRKFDFGGRLADYAYYDMDMTISAALIKFQKIKKMLS